MRLHIGQAYQERCLAGKEGKSVRAHLLPAHLCWMDVLFSGRQLLMWKASGRTLSPISKHSLTFEKSLHAQLLLMSCEDSVGSRQEAEPEEAHDIKQTLCIIV